LWGREKRVVHVAKPQKTHQQRELIMGIKREFDHKTKVITNENIKDL